MPRPASYAHSGLCQQSNDFSEGLDVRYRTYTLVIGVDASNYGLGRVLLNDAAKLTSLKTQPQTVWRYQLMLYCNNKISELICSTPAETFSRFFHLASSFL